MLRKPVACFMAAILALGALAVVVSPADARPRGGRGGGGRGVSRSAARVGGFRGGFRGGRPGVRVGVRRGFVGPRFGVRGVRPGVRGFRRGFVGPRFGVGGWGGVGGFGWPSGGYIPYGSGWGYVPYDNSGSSFSYNNYDPSGTTSGYSSPDSDVDETPAVPDDSAQAPTDNTAHLMFVVPENATIWVEGQKTNQTGTQREFFSPPLTPGKRFTYTVRVRSQGDNGRAVDETRKVYVRAGDRWRVDFTKAAPKTK